MIHFLHIRDLLSQEQIETIKAPIRLELIKQFDNIAEIKQSDVFEQIIFRQKGSWLGFAYREADDAYPELILPLRAPYEGGYAAIYKSVSHGCGFNWFRGPFGPKVLEPEMNPIVFLHADNIEELFDGMRIYRENFLSTMQYDNECHADPF